MGCKFSFKRVFLVASLSLAGLFGISSIIANNFDSREAKEASANDFTVTVSSSGGSAVTQTISGVTYRVVYYYVDSNWDAQYRFDPDDKYTYQTGDDECHYFCYSNSASISDVYKQTRNQFGTGSPGQPFFSKIISDYCAILYLPSDTKTVGFGSYKGSSTYSTLFTSQYRIGSYGQACVVTTSNYEPGLFNNNYQQASWMTISTFLSTYLKSVKFTISSEWNGKKYDLSDLWVWCKHTGSDGKQIKATERNGRSFKVTNDMIHEFGPKKRRYAEIYVPARTGSYFRIQQSSYDYDYYNTTDPEEATQQIAVSAVSSNQIIDVTSNNPSSNQTCTLKTMPSVSSGYYLVGAGSFTSSGDKWTTGTGIEMSSDFEDKAIILNQYLEAGDAFTISNSAYDEVYTHANMSSSSLGTHFFVQAVKANLQVTIGNYNNSPTYTYWHDFNDAPRAYMPKDGNVTVYANKSGAPGWYGDNYGRPAFYIYDTSTSEDKWIDGTHSDDYTQYTFELNINNISKYKMFRRYNQDGSGGDWSGSGDDRTDFTNFDYMYLNCAAQTYKPIYVKQSGYYDIHLTSSGEILIKACFEEMYLDLDQEAGTTEGKWQKDGAKMGAYFFNSDDLSEAKAVFMTLMHDGTNNDHQYEVIVPELSTGSADTLIFLRLNPTGQASAGASGWWVQLPDNKYYEVWNQTTDVTFEGTVNKFTLDGTTKYEDEKNKYNWQRDGLISYTNRADLYGDYFLANIGCTGSGAVPPAGSWSDFETEYNNMCQTVQDLVHDTVADPSISGIKHAMATYDFIVKKYTESTYNDFINRKTNETSILFKLGDFDYYSTTTMFPAKEMDSSIIVIVIISSISIISITALSVLLVKKRKSQ